MAVEGVFGQTARSLVAAAGFGAILFLAACQTQSHSVGDGTVASSTGVSYLADIRSSNGLSKLSPDPTLERAALRQSKYMAQSGRMDHTTQRGKDFAARMRDDGVKGAAAENIAQGGMEPAKLFSMWMNSAGHRRNMLDPRFSKFGLAYVSAGKDSDKRYWTLILGR